MKELPLNQILCGDCVNILKDFPNESIDLVVTSPPYDKLRNYEGFIFDFEKIVKTLYGIIKRGGVVVWVVNDSTINGSESGTSFEQALYFKKVGFNLHDTMIFAKRNYVPLTHNRYEQAFEYMFVFSKGKPKTFNPIKVTCRYAGVDKNPKYVCASTKENSAFRSGIDRPITINNYKIKSNIFYYGVGKNMSAKETIVFQHPAVFPEKLAMDHIKSWSNENDVVLDPMCGSGTTMVAAHKLNRRWIGIDISKEYCENTIKRLEMMGAFSKKILEFMSQ